MSKQKEMMALHQAFSPFFKKMLHRYSSYHLKVEADDPASLAASNMRYITEIHGLSIAPEEVEQFASLVLDKRDYASRPPSPRELAFAISDLVSSRKSPLRAALSELYERMRERYQRLWVQDSDRTSVIEQWVKVGEAVSATPGHILTVEARITGDPEYRKYPPTTIIVEEAIRIVAFDAELPLVSEAFHQAVTQTVVVHPLIKHARSKFGAHALKTRTDMRVRTEFEQFYAGIVNDYIHGRLQLEIMKEELDMCQDAQGGSDQVLSASELMKVLTGKG